MLGAKPLRSLQQFNPQLAAEWSTRNTPLVPSEVSVSSSQKVWWVGVCGHEWEAKISGRNSGSKCPACVGKTVVAGFNDLATTHPELAVRYHPTKNTTPIIKLSAGMKKKVWWQDELGHEWEASVANSCKHHGCPFCSGQKALPGFNDIASLRLDLSALWGEKNTLKPHQVTVNSGHKILWECVEKHQWEQTVQKMSSKSSATLCPYCSRTKVLAGFNDLVTTHPKSSTEWHPVKNAEKPTQVMASSTKKVWWICDDGHEWEETVVRRVQKQTKCVYCINRRVLPGFNDLNTVNKDVAAQWHPTKNSRTSHQVSYGSRFQAWWVCHKGHEWQTPVYVRASGKLSQCPSCQSKTFSSKGEKELLDYVISLGFETKHNDRSILPHQEIDIYVPSQRIGLEYNGVYWHSELFQAEKAKTRHYDKWLAAKNVGVQLIQIWEDDWRRNSELVKIMVAHKLGVTQQRKVFARKTSTAEVLHGEAKLFLEKNHIQGFASGTKYLALQDAEKTLVAIMVVRIDYNKSLNIIRYATAANVVGGFTKLLKHAETIFTPSSVFTFADHTVSDGKLYEMNGFTESESLKPDYSYVMNGERKHKFGYRLKKFHNDPNLLWVEGATEKELAAVNKIYRIWDAGKTKYSKTVHKKT